MEKSVNKVELKGNVGMEPKIVKLDGGATLVRFPLATHENYRNRDGEWKEETTDEFCVIRPSTPSSCSDIKLFLPLHSKGFHFVGRQLIEAGQPPVPAGSAASLCLDGYEVAPVLEGMEGQPGPRLPFEAGVEGLDRA